jgi:3-oxoacid CoA-transferase subunit B
VAGAQRVIVAMQHCDNKGGSKLVKKCTLPLTGVACVHRIVSDMAVIDVTKAGFELREVAPGYTVEDLIKATAAPLKIAPDWHTMRV